MTILILLAIALLLAIVGASSVTVKPRAAFYFLTASVAMVIVTLALPIFVK